MRGEKKGGEGQGTKEDRFSQVAALLVAFHVESSSVASFAGLIFRTNCVSRQRLCFVNWLLVLRGLRRHVSSVSLLPTRETE